MLNLLKKTKNQIGLDISPEGITLVFLVEENNVISLKKHSYKPFDKEFFQNGQIEKPEFVTETLSAMINDCKLNGEKAVLSVPSNVVFIKRITLPDLPDEELKAIAPQEASKHLPLTMQELNVDFQILENTRRQDETGKKVDVILCALSKSVARSYLDVVNNAGLYVDSVDISSFAMIRALSAAELINEPEKTYISVRIGYENTDINLIQNGMPLFSHSVQTGKKNVIENIMNNLHKNREEVLNMLQKIELIIPGAEMSADPELNQASTSVRNIYGNISSEIQKAIEFFNSEIDEPVNIEKILIGGCGVCLQNIDKYISNKTRIEAVIFNPFKNISQEIEQTEDILSPINIPSFSTSIGLALKGLEN